MAYPAVGPSGRNRHLEISRLRERDLRTEWRRRDQKQRESAQHQIGKILVSVAALTRTASSVGEFPRPSAPDSARLRARQAGMTDSRVHRLYLQRPGHAVAELDGLRAERQVAPEVTGYASIAQARRWQRIDGFLG